MPNGLDELTAETLHDIVQKAQTAGVLTSTGIQGVDLSGLVSLVPVNVPARNNTSAFPRTIAKEGAQVTSWRALLNVNNQQADVATGFDYAGPITQLDEQDVYAPFKPLAEGYTVTLDAIGVSRNFADVKAVAQLQSLNQLFIGQDMHIINSQNWSLGTPATPTLTASSTGGTIGAGSAVHVKVSARSGANYFVGGNSPASSDASTTTSTTTSTGSVTATIAAVKGAVAYDWYVGSSSSNQVYYTTTTVATVTITTVPTAAQAVPSSVLPLLSTTAPPSTPPTADTSYSSKWYNGVIASSLGDYGSQGPVTPGTGNSSGAIFLDNAANAPQLVGSSGVDVLDNLNQQLWASVQLSPTAYMMNSLTASYISQLLLGSTASVTYLPPTDADARTNLAGGGYIARYINKAAGGVPVSIEVHPRVAPGTIIARTDRVPFPGSNIGSAFDVHCQYDTMEFQYAANRNANVLGGGPRYDGEIRSLETLRNFAPAAQGVTSNIHIPGTAGA